MISYHKLVSFFFIITAVFQSYFAEAASNGKVFILHSYHEEFAWVKGINEALTQRFDEADIDYTFFYMDTKRKPALSWKEKAGELARKKIETYKPDVVIAVDDNAKNHGLTPYVGKKWPRIVFCGINDNSDIHHYQPQNITGIFERTYIHQTLDLLKTFNPGIEKVAFLSDDSSTAKLIIERAKRYMAEGSLPVDLVDFFTPATFPEWQAVILNYDKDQNVGGFLIPLYHTVRKNGESEEVIPSFEVMRWATKNTSKPIVGLWPFSTQDGALAAVAVDPLEHGWTAADMTIKILSGTPVATLLPKVNKAGAVHFNSKTAEAMGIEVSYDLLESFDVIIE